MAGALGPYIDSGRGGCSLDGIVSPGSVAEF
jgi:hypothetical protein